MCSRAFTSSTKKLTNARKQLDDLCIATGSTFCFHEQTKIHQGDESESGSSDGNDEEDVEEPHNVVEIHSDDYDEEDDGFNDGFYEAPASPTPIRKKSQPLDWPGASQKQKPPSSTLTTSNTVTKTKSSGLGSIFGSPMDELPPVSYSLHQTSLRPTRALMTPPATMTHVYTL
ncbi:hypothetical protein BJ508DRAFT_332644 [Ascobolus immersus RN42]|uniref:Uncharacterized protein n=1 Tax=Ascobolus immersus RN42 TaxID=1160509 RepID=A0A3N4HM21_ASCIM|nr:hypothetical protein BJ508DRAFT_332644 [Ascobolus immersus RN42]